MTDKNYPDYNVFITLYKDIAIYNKDETSLLLLKRVLDDATIPQAYAQSLLSPNMRDRFISKMLADRFKFVITAAEKERASGNPDELFLKKTDQFLLDLSKLKGHPHAMAFYRESGLNRSVPERDSWRVRQEAEKLTYTGKINLESIASFCYMAFENGIARSYQYPLPNTEDPPANLINKGWIKVWDLYLRLRKLESLAVNLKTA